VVVVDSVVVVVVVAAGSAAGAAVSVVVLSVVVVVAAGSSEQAARDSAAAEAATANISLNDIGQIPPTDRDPPRAEKRFPGGEGVNRLSRKKAQDVESLRIIQLGFREVKAGPNRD
jgi:hypothetical protein